MNKQFIVSSFLILFSFHSFGQSGDKKIYFDNNGRLCAVETAQYYRLTTDTPLFYRSYYSMNDRPYFSGKIVSADPSDEHKNVYSGSCTWFYKNGNPKCQRTFTDKGEENGLTKYYYESGKIWKEIEFEKGKPRNSYFTEYNEDGSRNKIFEDNFNNNFNEWELFNSDKSSASIANGELEIVSVTKEGTSRFINYPVESDQFAIEAEINISGFNDNDKAGLIYGFKDWQNYHYFAISKRYIYIGSFYEGVKSVLAEAMYCQAINPMQENVIKIISNGEKLFFSVNGEVQFKNNLNRFFGNNIGFVVGGKTKIRVNRFVVKELNATAFNSVQKSVTDRDVKITGSGLIISSGGYIITNYHVIEKVTRFSVELSDKNTYKAEVIISDKDNDLAILKITDEQYIGSPVKYTFKENGLIDVGAGVFTIGFPYALSGMGKEAKFSDGKVSSRTGYNGSLNSFQTTIPVQPGNSGGPVFNHNGQLVGLINATFKEADNVSYAIKLNYIRNLIEMLTESIDVPATSDIEDLTLEEKLKVLTNYVVLIKGK